MRKRLIVLGGALVFVGMLAVSQVPTSSAAKASSAVRYVRGYSVQGSWFCYGWTRPAIYHCTQHWRWQSGSPHSLTGFVPNGLPGAGGSVSSVVGSVRTGVTSVATPATAGQPCHSAVTFPAHISQWTAPSGCYARIFRPDPQNYVSRPSYGWCNWWPEVLHPRFSGSNALHQASHSAPRVGAVVFFAPHVQGASSDGHYAQVVAIGPSGWLLITEMNFYWRGGGFAKVDYRFIHTGAGVSFRY